MSIAERTSGGSLHRQPKIRVAVAVGVLLLVAGTLNWRSWDRGRRDNSDWHRYAPSFATVPLGFAAPGEEATAPPYRPKLEFDWHPEWRRKSPSEAPSSRRDTGSIWLLWLPGWVLNVWLAEPGVLDLRLLGLPVRASLLCLLVLLVGTLARRAPSGRAGDLCVVLAAVALAAVHCDVSVLSYANTFFREPAAQLFTLGLLTLVALPADALRGWPWWFGAILTLAMCAAPVHVVLWVPALVVVRRFAASHRRRALWSLVVAAAVAGAYGTFSMIPELRNIAAYNAFFFGVVMESQQPAEQVRRAELAPGALDLVGRPAFHAAGSEFLAGDRRLGHSDVLFAVLREPGALARLLRRGAEFLGPGAGPPGVRAAGSRGRRVSTLEAPWWHVNRQLARSGAVAWALLGGIVVLALHRGRKPHDAWEETLASLALFTALGAAVEIAGNLLGDGYSAAPRHFFLARLLFDQALVFGGLLAVTKVLAGRRRREVARPAPPQETRSLGQWTAC